MCQEVEKKLNLIFNLKDMRSAGWGSFQDFRSKEVQVILESVLHQALKTIYIERMLLV